jgi:hypothetical protein
MKNITKLQIAGMFLLLIGILINFLANNTSIETLAGMLSAVGIALIFKWIPFNKINKI